MINLDDLKSYDFEDFLNDIKKKDTRTLLALCENYNVDNDVLFTLKEIAEIYDNWEFHCKYAFPTQYPIEKTLYEFFNKTLPVEKFLDKIKNIPSCVQYDSMDIGGTICVYFAIDEAISIKEDNIQLHPDDENDIKNICISYGYYENSRYIVNTSSHGKLIAIDFIANYTEEVTDIVYNLNHPKYHPENAVLYHLCPKSIWENKIKKTGLIPKCKNKHKRNYYDPRIYFFYMYDKNKFKKYAKDLSDGKETEWVVLKIDLKMARDKYRFFRDPEYLFPLEACFTYETIHPRCISLKDEIHIV